MTRKVRLGAFLPGSGQDAAAWRHPDSPADGATRLSYHVQLAQEAERGLFDAYFLADGLTVFRDVVLPASVSAIFVGLRLSANTALLLLIAAEMIGANKGLGFQVMNAQYNFQIPLMFSAIFLPAALGPTANYLFVFLQRRLCRWSEIAR